MLVQQLSLVITNVASAPPLSMGGGVETLLWKGQFMSTSPVRLGCCSCGCGHHGSACSLSPAERLGLFQQFMYHYAVVLASMNMHEIPYIIL
jgi:hypothetical protein